jgi:hypothetical protein
MTNNGVIKTLCPGNKVQLVLLDGRIFKGLVVGNGVQQWVELTDKYGDQFTVKASRLSRCLGMLEVVE